MTDQLPTAGASPADTAGPVPTAFPGFPAPRPSFLASLHPGLTQVLLGVQASLLHKLLDNGVLYVCPVSLATIPPRIPLVAGDLHGRLSRSSVGSWPCVRLLGLSAAALALSQDGRSTLVARCQTNTQAGVGQIHRLVPPAVFCIN